MISRNPERSDDIHALEDRLTWSHGEEGSEENRTSFTSFFLDWRRALKWAQRAIRDSKTDVVVVIAVCSDGLTNLYDAYAIACEFRKYKDVKPLDYY